MQNLGTFYLVSSPIGNLKDITLRALEVLKKVDKIFAEDTRISSKLLYLYKISKPIFSLHSYNEEQRLKFIFDELTHCRSIAYICDSGTPCISDPGSKIINALKQNKFKFTIIPGPSACTSAVAISGFSGSGFIFFGFLPRKKNDIKKRLENYINARDNLVIFESPRRLINTLSILLDLLGDRECVVTRELTKTYEECIYGKLSEVIEKFNNINPRGEITLVIKSQVEENIKDLIDTKDYLIKDLIKKIAKEWGIKKNILYNEIVKLKERLKETV